MIQSSYKLFVAIECSLLYMVTWYYARRWDIKLNTETYSNYLLGVIANLAPIGTIVENEYATCNLMRSKALQLNAATIKFLQ